MNIRTWREGVNIRVELRTRSTAEPQSIINVSDSIDASPDRIPKSVALAV